MEGSNYCVRRGNWANYVKDSSDNFQILINDCGAQLRRFVDLHNNIL